MIISYCYTYESPTLMKSNFKYKENVIPVTDPLLPQISLAYKNLLVILLNITYFNC